MDSARLDLASTRVKGQRATSRRPPADDASTLARHMALQPPKYTDAQRAAILRAVLDANPPVSVPAACKLAAAGELRDANGNRLDAWQMHPGTARDYVARERRRRDAARRRAQGTTGAAEQLAGEVLELAAAHVRALKRRRNLTAKDVKDAGSMVREVLALARDANLTAPGLDAPAGSSAPAAAPDAGALAAAAAEIAAQTTPPPEPPTREDGNHPGNGTPGNV